MDESAFSDAARTMGGREVKDRLMQPDTPQQTPGTAPAMLAVRREFPLVLALSLVGIDSGRTSGRL